MSKNAILRALIEGVIHDLMVRTDVYNVQVDDSTTLADKLAQVIASLNGKAKLGTASAVLPASGWTDNAATVAVSGVTADNTVIASPAGESYGPYRDHGVRCTAQDAGTLCFACDSPPAQDITVNLLILT